MISVAVANIGSADCKQCDRFRYLMISKYQNIKIHSWKRGSGPGINCIYPSFFDWETCWKEDGSLIKITKVSFCRAPYYDWYCPNQVDNQLCLVILYISVRFRCGDASNPYFTCSIIPFPIIIQFTNVMQSAMHTPTAMFVGNIILRATVYEVTYINVRYVR